MAMSIAPFLAHPVAADATASQSHLLLPLNTDWFYLSGVGLYPGCPGNEAVKRV